MSAKLVVIPLDGVPDSPYLRTATAETLAVDFAERARLIDLGELRDRIADALVRDSVAQRMSPPIDGSFDGLKAADAVIALLEAK